jgi:CubicO group peptidase (beta-lactamase class C family)
MRHRRAWAGLTAFLLLAFAAATLQSQAPAAAPPNLDAYVAQVLRTFQVPGIALAVVKDGAVVVAKGYGVRKADEAAAVDAKTLFGIASNTKADHLLLEPVRKGG